MKNLSLLTALLLFSSLACGSPSADSGAGVIEAGPDAQERVQTALLLARLDNEDFGLIPIEPLGQLVWVVDKARVEPAFVGHLDLPSESVEMAGTEGREYEGARHQTRDARASAA